MIDLAVRLRAEGGQSIVFVALGLTVIVGLCALVIDVGSWFREQRHLQVAADAAALAGAQDLPNTGVATSTAAAYASNNVSGLDAWTPTFPATSPCAASACIDVRLSKAAPGYFSRIFDLSSVTVHAHARAMVGVPGSLKSVAPIAIKTTSACLTGSTGCFGATKRLKFIESNLSSSAFGLVSLSCQGASASSCSGSGTGASDLVTWIQTGYPGLLDVNKWYAAVTGEKIGPVRDALEAAAGRVLLIPVFDVADSSALSFHVVGWGAFVIDSGGVIEWKNDVPGCRPDCKVLQGHFVEYIAHGVVSSSSGTGFGVRVVALVQ
jgi:hypothetical protein